MRRRRGCAQTLSCSTLPSRRSLCASLGLSRCGSHARFPSRRCRLLRQFLYCCTSKASKRSTYLRCRWQCHSRFHSRRYLGIRTRGTRNSAASLRRRSRRWEELLARVGRLAPLPERLLCQFLYCCTSTASKVSTELLFCLLAPPSLSLGGVVVGPRNPRWDSPVSYSMPLF